MDSGNSGSLQSSSGGDEEYDSRAADSMSSFIINAHHKPITGSPPPLYDPLSGYLQLNQNPNQHLLVPNVAWTRPTLRSDPNHTFLDIMNDPMLSASPSLLPSFQPPPSIIGDARPPPQAQHQPPPPPRNSKKRTRASRRAPTTVLTTDTTNFRAMVQEFTGIPALPFSNSSFPRNRLDLFGSRSTSIDAPPYLRRPFAQKLQSPPPFFPSSSSSFLSSTAFDAIAASSSATNNNNNVITSLPQTTNSTPASANNYQQPITSNLYNPLLNSLLQTNPRFPFSSSPSHIMNSSKTSFGNIPQNNLKLGGLDEFGLSHGNHTSSTLSALPNLISSDQFAGRNELNDQANDTNNAGSWRNNGVGPDENQAPLRSINGVGNFSNNINPMASTSSFHGERGTENNVAARGEGMVESWICSSE